MAEGAIFSPALLLRSGLGNALVGRRLLLHLVTACLGVYPDPVRMWSGAAQTAVCTEFERASGRHGFWIEAAPAHPGLAALAVPWISGEGHKRQMMRLAHTGALIVLVRDRGSGSAVDWPVVSLPPRSVGEGWWGAVRVRGRVREGLVLRSLPHKGGG